MGTIKVKKNPSVEDTIERYIFIKGVEGLSTATTKRYATHLKTLGKYIDYTKPIDELNRDDIYNTISVLQERNLSPNTIASYMRVLNAFLSWARNEGLTRLTAPTFKSEETVKETYTDEELAILLRKPNLRTCRFPTYRTWVIICFLMNSGARASTVRYIKIKDVDLENGLISYRHNKGKKVQVIPLCTEMVITLKEYLKFRGGKDDDYLFCTEEGEQLTVNGLHTAIERYNKSKGVEKTSTHLFRHTFAKKYLLECGGDAFTLQKLLGHSTLDMTRHYCNLYDKDLLENFDDYSPLQRLKPKESKITLKKK